MNTDLDTRLAELKPAPQWDEDARQTLLARVLADDAAPARPRLRMVGHRPRRRLAAVVALAGVAAAAAIALPAVLPAGSPGGADPAAAAVALRHLAAIAAVSPSDDLGPGEYLHTVRVDHQPARNGQPGSRSRFESWTSSTGLVWQHRQIDTTGRTPDEDEVWLVTQGGDPDDPAYPTPQYLATLPTKPAALEAYLRAHRSGSSSADENVFVVLGDLLYGGVAPSTLRSAAIDVLADLDHVRLGDATRDAAGNPVQEFVFHDPQTRPGEDQSYMFDTRTAELTQLRSYVDGDVIAYQGTLVESGIAHSVPADIRREAVRQP